MTSIYDSLPEDNKSIKISSDDQFSKLLLVALPWPRTENISIELGVLKSFLNHNKVDCEARYYYKELESFIGDEVHNFIESNNLQQFGFSALLFEEKYNNIKNYFLEIFESFNFDKYIENLRLYSNQIVDDILKTKADIIGFTTSFLQLIPSLYISRLLKQKNKSIKIILGGQCLSSEFAENIIEMFDEIDYIVVGEGEITLLELLYADKNKEKFPLEKIDGLIFKNNYGIKKNKPRTLIHDLNILPVPDYDEYFNNYISNTIIPYPKMVIEASRGCYYNGCIFCNLNIQWGEKYRKKSDEKVINEIEILVEKYKSLDIMFCDTNVSNRKSLFKKLAKLGLNLTIYAEFSGHSDGSKKDTYVILKEAGIKEIQIGIESLSNNVLKTLKKGVTLMKNFEMLKWCAELNIKVFYNLIVGNPSENFDDINETIDSIRYLKHYQPPARLTSFILAYKCKADKNIAKYGIKGRIINEKFETLIPNEVLNKIGPIFNLIVGYNVLPKFDAEKWENVKKEIEEWRDLYEYNKNSPSFHYYTQGSFMILKKKKKSKTHFYRLEGLPFRIFKFSINESKTFEQFLEEFTIDSSKLQKILNAFIKKKFMFNYSNEYLSLPIKELF